MIDLLRDFNSAGIPEDLAISIIQFLRNWKDDQNYRVSPLDDLAHDYGLVDEDLDDLVLEIAEVCGRKPPNDISYWSDPVRTAGDVAMFVMTFPQKATGVKKS